MPRKNRVNPWGEIIAVPDRGMFMGNRGCIHRDGNIVRSSARKAWVTCLLEFRGRHREIMAVGRYTELFFLDEATALAAGHRPCATCRRGDYRRFKHLWTEANAGQIETPSIRDIDNLLHGERVTNGSKKTWQARLDELPDGVMITSDGASAYLILEDKLLEWSPGGYLGWRPRDAVKTVSVLTPFSTAQAIASGYRPYLHPSAEQ